MSLSAYFEIATQDQQTINTSLSNDVLFVGEKSNQKFRFGNAELGSEYLVIHSNVGIGISDPTSKLHVLGDGYFSCNLCTNGNLGIGNSNPQYSLDIYGTSYFRSNLIVYGNNTTLGGTLNISGVTSLSNQLYVSSTSIFNSNLVVNSSNTTLGGSLNVSGASAFSNTTTFTSNLIVSSKNTSLLGTLNVTGVSALSNQLYVTGTSTFNSNLVVSSYNTSLLGTLNVSGASAFSNTTTFTSNLIVSSKNTSLLGTLNVTGISALSNQLYVTGTSTFNSNLVVSSYNTSLLGTLNVSGASAFSNTTTFTSNLIVSSKNTSLLGTLNITGVSALSNQLYVTGTSTFNSNLVVSSSNTSLLGTLNVSGASAFSNTTTFTSNLIVSSKNTSLLGTLNVTDVSALSNQLYVTGTSTFNSNLVVSSSNTSLLGTLNVSGASAFSNTATHTSNLIVFGNFNTSLGGTLNVTDVSALSNQLYVTGTSTFNSNLVVSSSNTSLLGTLNVSGASAFSNTATHTSNLIVFGNFNTSLGGTLNISGVSSLSNQLYVTGTSTFNSNLVVSSSNTSLLGTLNVSGASAFSNTTTHTSNLIVSGNFNTSLGGTLNISGVSSLSNQLYVYGTSTFNSNLIVSSSNTSLFGSLNVTGASAFSNIATFSSNVNISGSLTINSDSYDITRCNLKILNSSNIQYYSNISTTYIANNNSPIYYCIDLIDSVNTDEYKPILYTNNQTSSISSTNGNWYLDNINGYIKFINKYGIIDSSINSQTIISINTYPPTAMTSDTTVLSNGTYVSSTSSYFNISTTASYLAFNKITNSSSFGWWSVTGKYSSTTGNYTGTQITTCSGTNYSGEWIQLQLPFQVALTRMMYYGPTSDLLRQPRDFVVAGSLDNTNWTFLVQQSTNGSTNIEVNLNNTNSYIYYRLIALNKGINTDTFVKINEIEFYEDVYEKYQPSIFNTYLSDTLTPYINFYKFKETKNSFVASNVNILGNCIISNNTILNSNLIVYGSGTLNNNLNISGTSIFNSNLIVSSSNTTLGGSFNVTGVSAFSNTTIFSSNLIVSSFNTSLLGTLNVSGASALSNQLYVSGTSTFNSNLIVNSKNTSLLGTLNVSGASAFSNTTTFSSNLVVNSFNTSLLGTLNVTGASAFSNTTTFSSNLVVSSKNTSLLGTLNVSGASAFSNTTTFSSNLIVNSFNTSLLGTLNVSGASAFSNTSTFTSNLIVKGECAFSSNIYVGTPGVDSNAILIYGGYGDNTASNYSGIMRRIYNSTESSELAMFCYNDSEGVSGPDRIRLIGANILLDTYTSATNSINDTSSTSTKLIITGAGNVGIGTMTSTYKLRVEGNTYINSDCTINGILYATRNNSVQTPANSTGEKLVLYTGSPNYSLGIENNYMWFNVDSSAGYKFYNNSTNLRMIINTSGYVGIGITNPSQLLYVNGTSQINGFLFVKNISINTAGTTYNTDAAYGLVVDSAQALFNKGLTMPSGIASISETGGLVASTMSIGSGSTIKKIHIVNSATLGVPGSSTTAFTVNHYLNTLSYSCFPTLTNGTNFGNVTLIALYNMDYNSCSVQVKNTMTDYQAAVISLLLYVY